MRVCFDLKTLYSQVGREPVPGAADMLRDLRTKGHIVILHTVLKPESLVSLHDELYHWGFVFDEVYFGKPEADVYIDARSLGVVNYDQVEQRVEELSACTLVELLDG